MTNTTEKRYYITTPIYYVNDKPHIGHGYTSIICDVLARYQKLMGRDSYFLTGTDEHGSKVARSAKKNNLAPQDFVDGLVPAFKDLLVDLDCTNDDFIRTTDARHKDFVQSVWKKMQEKQHVYLGTYSGWYSVRDECFYQENEIIDGKAPTGAAVEWLEEETYFFKLSSFQDKLLKFYEENPNFIQPQSRKNEVISFVKRGLRDLSVSRTSFKWGIPVPGDDKHVIYVWLDALFNYISAINEEYSSIWPCDMHVVGKDILIFHAVYWPAFLMSLDLPLPKCVFAHGWWTNNGEKISKSLGNVIDPVHLINTFSSDYVRYFMMREVPTGEDGNYSDDAFINRVNAELVNNIGNLCQRVISLINKKCNSQVPAQSSRNQIDDSFISYSHDIVDQFNARMQKIELHLALNEIVMLGSAANAYIENKKPWEQSGQDLETTLTCLINVIRIIGTLLQPFIPVKAMSILSMLGINEPANIYTCKNDDLAPGTKISTANIIFTRLEK